jgi:2-succinyl-6-hydroxy-2,4-cyclohexadiene-1-carboxylate synthase
LISNLWSFQSLGDPAAPALVFLHGFLGRGADWLPVVEQLAPEFHCILPDLPGHGANTGFDPSQPLTFDSLSADLTHTLAEAGLDRPVLIGYSLGGRLALHAACRFPERFSALVLESASPGLRSESEREARRRLDDARAARLLEFGLTPFIAEWYRADLWASLRGRPELLAELAQARSGAGAIGAAKALADLSPGRMDPLWDGLPDLPMRVLLLSGDLDTQYTAISAEAAGLIPSSVHIRIPGAGHNVHLEQPQEFAGTLQLFLRRIRPLRLK